MTALNAFYEGNNRFYLHAVNFTTRNILAIKFAINTLTHETVTHVYNTFYT